MRGAGLKDLWGVGGGGRWDGRGGGGASYVPRDACFSGVKVGPRSEEKWVGKKEPLKSPSPWERHSPRDIDFFYLRTALMCVVLLYPGGVCVGGSPQTPARYVFLCLRCYHISRPV